MDILGAVILAGLAVVALGYSAKGQWSYLPPSEASKDDLRAVPGWLQPVVKHHNPFKYGSGLVVWLSMVLIVATKGQSKTLTYLLFCICGLSGGIYGLTLSWRFTAITNRARSRKKR